MSDNLLRFSHSWWVYWLFDRFQWFRRRAGGHWELWWNEATKSLMWEHTNFCTQTGVAKMRGIRPPCSFGTPTCEDYPC
jgi:hypothetical protein